MSSSESLGKLCKLNLYFNLLATISRSKTAFWLVTVVFLQCSDETRCRLMPILFGEQGTKRGGEHVEGTSLACGALAQVK